MDNNNIVIVVLSSSYYYISTNNNRLLIMLLLLYVVLLKRMGCGMCTTVAICGTTNREESTRQGTDSRSESAALPTSTMPTIRRKRVQPTSKRYAPPAFTGTSPIKAKPKRKRGPPPMGASNGVVE